MSKKVLIDGVKTLNGKTAIVTGASRGIGRTIAFALAAEGAAVVVNGRSQKGVEEVATQLRATGARATSYAGSVADFKSAGELIECCKDTFGTVDILANVAGIAEPPGISILDTSYEEWRALIDTNLTGTFNTCRQAIPLMVEQGSGSIINTSSHAYLGKYGGAGYPASKGGVNSLTFSIAAMLKEQGIRANAVCPGARTDLNSGPDFEKNIRDLHSRGMMSSMLLKAALSPPPPEFVAPIYAVLASELGAGINGQIFTAAGGYVGIHTSTGGEKMIGLRSTEDGPWPIEDLAACLQSGLGRRWLNLQTLSALTSFSTRYLIRKSKKLFQRNT